ncbi:MAG TPA: TetR family transcriptional regulator [Reyranella sp.]|jgi:AcrR family transcriptional regulator
MSRVRTRPTRDDTKEKLFDAAAEMFEQHGIGAASIEAIAAAAGMTRGAFYSNFESKDDLIIAMLEDHVERSLKHHRELLAKHREPEDFIAALRSAERGRHDPLGRAPLLHIEMILFAARSEKRRPELAKRLKARRDMVAEILTQQKIGDPAWTSAMLLALEDGFRLHRLVDPASTPADSFFRALTGLLKLSRP